MPQPRTGQSVLPAEGDAPAYETFYGLRDRPFGLTPDPKFLYHSAAHDRVSEEVETAMRAGDAVTVITGENGIGKTLLCRVLIDRLDRNTIASFVARPVASFDDLLKIVLVDFGVIAREDLAPGAVASELVEALRTFLSSLAALQANAAIFVDDAHRLPIDALDRLRALLDVDASAGVLQLLLIGEPPLAGMLKRSGLKSLDDRVTLRTRLDGLAFDEIAGYVTHRLAVGGTNPRVAFDDEAYEEIFEATGGVPLRVNQVCDRALTLGHQVSAAVIDREVVRQAAKDISLGTPRTSRGVARAMAAAAGFVLLMLVGAGAAAWVFQDRLATTIAEWESRPRPPAPPLPRVAVPAAPVLLPEQ